MGQQSKTSKGTPLLKGAYAQLQRFGHYLGKTLEFPLALFDERGQMGLGLRVNYCHFSFFWKRLHILLQCFYHLCHSIYKQKLITFPEESFLQIAAAQLNEGLQLNSREIYVSYGKTMLKRNVRY